jgi:hypothetical protein
MADYLALVDTVDFHDTSGSSCSTPCPDVELIEDAYRDSHLIFLENDEPLYGDESLLYSMLKLDSDVA